MVMRNLVPTNNEQAGVRLSKNPTWVNKLTKSVKRYYWLYIFLIPTLLYYLIWHYIPMGGIVVAFQRYTGAKSIIDSDWVGLKWFENFFSSHFASRTIINTMALSLLSLATFPIPIVLALILNEIRSERYKRFAQTIMYAPHFISMVVLVSMLNIFFDPNYGFINTIIELCGGEARNFMGESESFRSLYVWSGVWQSTGWNCIIYVSALSGVDTSMHEAATLDGASRLQRILHVNLPTIAPTIIIMLIMRVGNIMSVGADKVLLMMNDLNTSTSEIIGTYVYSRGLLGGDFSYATAVGLFTNVINLIMLLTVNKISSKVSETSLF
ncbi:MAG: sugar ABC transporter permease [Oscillospiraceae bacterium]|nr:sugar ABC transporter permease [Oscillospiraceae bacterium]